MQKNFKKRIFTSTALILLLLLMFLNVYVLAYFLMLIGIFSILEFFNIISRLQYNEAYKVFFFNFMFTLYVFILFSTFLILSFFPHLKILLFIILLTCVFSDIGGYIFGKILKGPKLTKISPQKTIAGSIGSILFSVSFLSLFIYYFAKNFNFNILIAGLLISIICQSGDLLFSYLKRKTNIKDTGKVLPGHGGILDRIDGILFGVPLGFLIITFIY